MLNYYEIVSASLREPPTTGLTTDWRHGRSSFCQGGRGWGLKLAPAMDVPAVGAPCSQDGIGTESHHAFRMHRPAHMQCVTSFKENLLHTSEVKILE